MKTKTELIRALLDYFNVNCPDASEAERRSYAMRLYLFDVSDLEILVSQIKVGGP